eukprot:2994282-Rhodomonas_salina.1
MMRRCQVDQHWAFLTCRESLEYAADLYLSESAEEKHRRVEDLLNQMGLMTCADTKCGNQVPTSKPECSRLPCS